ncbi:hypothetical protein [Janthinobacterium sp. LB3P112]
MKRRTILQLAASGTALAALPGLARTRTNAEVKSPLLAFGTAVRNR